MSAAPAVLGTQAEVWAGSGRDREWQGSGTGALADAICDPHHFYDLSAVYSTELWTGGVRLQR